MARSSIPRVWQTVFNGPYPVCHEVLQRPEVGGFGVSALFLALVLGVLAHLLERLHLVLIQDLENGINPGKAPKSLPEFGIHGRHK